MNGEHKITSSHRERTALVYLRQSSMVQVREHTESTHAPVRPGGQGGRGWAGPRSDIEVIDTDLGISGKCGVAREGFTELVARVCSGEVGAIFGIEISRLARSNADVARLVEFARITGTLLIDPDGVYDPADVNDRLLLGLKGTMGEIGAPRDGPAAARGQAGRRRARRAAHPAAGRAGPRRRPDDTVIDPDAEVQAAIARRVRRVHRLRVGLRGGRRVRRPAVPAARLRRRVGRAAALGQAHPRPRPGRAEEPCYAGAYVLGRYTSRRTVDAGRHGAHHAGGTAPRRSGRC